MISDQNIKNALEVLIQNYSDTNLYKFLELKTEHIRKKKNDFTSIVDKDFLQSLNQIAEIELENEKKMFVITGEMKKELNERTGKKKQYDVAKDILKSNHSYDCGIFVFYDGDGNFRFSLIFKEYLGVKVDVSTFKRYTYYVCKEFTNKTYLQRIGNSDFSSFAKIKEAFSVEKVTKEFYQDIANWYFWAVSHCQFPKDVEAEENGRNIAVIRLITRIIFIWFMRERGLINKSLFEKQQIQDILKNLNNDESSYYTAILQNLFFATLSTKKGERQFGSKTKGHRGYNPDFGNQYVFRYQEMFKNSGNIKDYFGDIPFLNGGLFECLDDKKNGIIIDGFSRTKKNQPKVPNLLFWGAEETIDLNKTYGTKSKTYKVRGLLNILSSFNFTIDENSPDDADIALDPELLGRVFENLLASFNPETSTTARKATGSYYTPREIVDYMVTESLKAYFQTHLNNIEKIDEKLEKLFSNEFSVNPFNANQSKKLVKLIENVKIVDPAVGSGAFPMGALNKLVFILNKIDPGNKLWKEAQLKAVDAIPDPSARRIAKERIEEFFEGKNADYGRKLYLIQRCIYGVDIQQIAVEIAKLRFFISLLVDEKIDKEKDNWGIEPLPNLDFKIMQGNSLISEFLGIDFDDGKYKQEQSGMLFDQDDDSLIKEFEQKKIDFQNEADKDNKIKLKQDVEDLMIRIFENKVIKQKGDYFRQLKEIEKKYSILHNQKQRDEIVAQEKQKLSKKSGFDLENIEKQLREFTSKKKTRPFFPWKLYFAEVFEKEGFDVVIANPPYIGEKGHKNIFKEVKNGGQIGKFYLGKMDFSYFFFHLALNLGNPEAKIAFITTNYYPTALGAKKLREDFRNRTILEKLINFNELKIFKSATGQHNMVTLLSKGQDANYFTKTCITKRTGEANSGILNSIVSWHDSMTEYYTIKQNDLYDGKEDYIRLPGNSMISDDPVQNILDKIKKQGEVLGIICNVNNGVFAGADSLSLNKKQEYNIHNAIEGEGIFVLTNEEVVNKKFTKEELKLIKPLYKNSDIKKYYTNSKNELNLINLRYTDRPNLESYPNFEKHLLKFKTLLSKRPETGTLESAFKNGYWYVMSTSRKVDMEHAKIVFPQRSCENTFGYNEDVWYAMSDVFFITDKKENALVKLKYILSILNSTLFYIWLYYRGKRKGETLELTGTPVSEIPIKTISEKDQKPFINLVDLILAITKSADYLQNPDKQAKVKEYEKQIDELVYKLYELTPEEIEIVEGSTKK
ncbi:MAG: TaqI-like C-terminal specificity domain-containing protein [bacterium]